MTSDEISLEKFAVTTVAPEVENENRKIVKMLYKTLRHGDTEKITKVVGTNLEWWYHGLPQCHYMMKLLTGESTNSVFKFRPRIIRTFSDRGRMGRDWGLLGSRLGLNHGITTQFLEYFNTSLTVVLHDSENGNEARIWQSRPRARVNGSLPNLVLVV